MTLSLQVLHGLHSYASINSIKINQELIYRYIYRKLTIYRSFSRDQESQHLYIGMRLKNQAPEVLDNFFDLGHQFIESIKEDILDNIDFLNYKSGSSLAIIIVLFILYIHQ